MPFVAAPRVVCPVCSQTVYVNDEVRIAENVVLHKTCLRCKQCNKVLQNTNFSLYEGTYYCKPHFLALFKARGKYEDLNPESNFAQTHRQSLSSYGRDDVKAPSSPTSGASDSLSTLKGKKSDLASALRSRNVQAVHSIIEKKGLGVMFAAGGDGITSIESAFTTGNLECGRLMLKVIADALQGQEFVWEKPDADTGTHTPAEEKHAAPVSAAAFSSHFAPEPEPEPVHHHHEPEPEPVYHHDPEPEPVYHHEPEPEPVHHHEPEPEPVYHHEPEPEPVYNHEPEPEPQAYQPDPEPQGYEQEHVHNDYAQEHHHGEHPEPEPEFA